MLDSHKLTATLPAMKKRGRPGWWPEALRDMGCGETIKAQTRSEAMSIYVAARRIGGMKISVKKDGETWLCEKVCL